MSRVMTLPAPVRFIERNWLSSNNILLVDGDDTSVVDTGYVAHAAQTVALIGHALQGKPLKRIVNTHAHSDHVGGNAALTAQYGCATTLPAALAQRVEPWDESRLPYETTGQRCARYGVDNTYGEGDVLRLGGMDWRAIATPGHDDESFALFCEDEGVLISADALWQQGFGLLFPNLAKRGATDADKDAVDSQRATLHTLAALHARVALPGHGAPFADVEAAIERALSKLEYLAGDPLRQARLALKVMISFRLMEEGKVELASLPGFFAARPFWRDVNDLFFKLPTVELAELAVTELEKTGAAKRENGHLVGVSNGSNTASRQASGQASAAASAPSSTSV
jgi:glyoxylase-like metal-dependent hydrolase (beta-lactamase superfamily II)